jgi:CRP-like cAMP-binding protein
MIQEHDPILFNKLLAALPQSLLESLKPDLEWTDLPMGQILYSSNSRMEYAYFPTSGICSVIAENLTGIQTETGLIGRDGFVGIPLIHYVDSAPMKVIVQAGGRGLKITRAKLMVAIAEFPELHIILLQFAHIFEVQVAQTALSNGHFKINQRLARWLLMCHDRVDSNDFPMTHRFLSVMLAVRRASITEALSYLESTKAIRALRGRIVILNRKLLEEMAEAAYGVPEREYQRLLKLAPHKS